MRKGLLSLLLAACAWAQPPVAPTNEPTGPPRGENVSNYNIRESFEAGYRFRETAGDTDMYRSTVNYGNGIRLLSSSLSVQSREGHGTYFDQILLTTQGLGNDPYQSASLRIEKNRLYRYELSWRSLAYFNPGLSITNGTANGEHLLDTTRRLQDQDLTLFPQGNFKLFLGYSRNTQSGPGLSTAQLFDGNGGDEFAVFANIHRQQDEYRLGGEAKLAGFRLNVMHGWVDFKEDSPLSLTTPSQGNNPDDFTDLNKFRRAEPYHGTSPYWRGLLFRESKWWAASARATYVSGYRAFVTDELANGDNRVGIPIQRQVLAFGDARRPTVAGNFTFTVFPASFVTITNQTSLYHIRMQGNSYFTQADNGAVPRPVLNFEFLGIRTLANTTDAEVRVKKWFAVHAGYAYDNRRIRSIQGFEVPPTPAPDSARVPYEQTNQLHSGILGIRFKPAKPLTINLDGEVGRADRPIYPISEKNYQAFRGRIEFKKRNYRLAAYARTNYNTNSASLAAYASKSRQYGLDASWNLKTWFSLDAGYGKQHLDTLAALDFYVLSGRISQLVTSDSSYYVSNIHTATLLARFEIRRRADISIGYSHIQDLGDGRATAVGSAIDSGLPAFQAAQTFPLRFNSPQARLSVILTPKIRWNAGYQFYGYREEFATLQNYRAHTGYSSVSWSF
jgi:hypothetical protein